MARTQKGTVNHVEEQVVNAGESKYCKEQILSSATFASRRDMLDALLSDGKEYTIGEVRGIIDGWEKEGVK